MKGLYKGFLANVVRSVGGALVLVRALGVNQLSCDCLP